MPPADPKQCAKSWAQIAGFFKHHDQVVMHDYDDDIKTLLIFTGLFSTVLTAFVIQSYGLLQQDKPQMTIDLLQQLVALQAGNSAGLPAVPTSFSPSAQSVAINILWFLSLVLTLASALFAMVAKQWVREHLRWMMITTSSADAILVAQLRYEGLKRWKLPAMLTYISTVLQLAVTLFLIGISILLFTLNNLVAYVLTTVISFAILFAIVTLILPTFFPACPYKTPFGWGIHCFVNGLWNKLLMCRRKKFPDWRTRDFGLQRWDGVTENDLHLDIMIGGQKRMKSADISSEAGRVYALTRALLWVREASQDHDEELLGAVNECLKTRNSLTLSHPDVISNLVFDYSITCETLGIARKTMQYFLQDWDLARFRVAPWTANGDARISMSTSTDTTSIVRTAARAVMNNLIHRESLPVITLLANLLSSSVLQMFDRLSTTSDKFEERQRRKIDELIAQCLVLSGHMMVNSPPTLPLQIHDDIWVGNFRRLLQLACQNERFADIGATAFYFMVEKVSRTLPNKPEIHERSKRHDHADSLVREVLGSESWLWTVDNCAQFVHIAHLVLRYYTQRRIRLESQDTRQLEVLFACMEKYVEHANERTEQEWHSGYTGWCIAMCDLFREPQMGSIFPHALTQILSDVASLRGVEVQLPLAPVLDS